MSSESVQQYAANLQEVLAENHQEALEPAVAEGFGLYLELLLKWNARTNLTAVRSVEGILERHFLESISAARQLPEGITTLLDLGSGAGFPGIPMALCRPELSVTLAESQGKKAAFLQEVVRQLGLKVKVHGRRAEELTTSFDCVTLRAVDKMHLAASVAYSLVTPAGWVAPLTSASEVDSLKAALPADCSWQAPLILAGGEQRVLLLGRKPSA